MYRSEELTALWCALSKGTDMARMPDLSLLNQDTPSCRCRSCCSTACAAWLPAAGTSLPQQAPGRSQAQEADHGQLGD